MKNTRMSPVSFFILLLTAILMFGLSPIVYLQDQSKEDRVLERVKDFNPPVDITLTRSRFGIIEADKKFSADEDWFKGLTVRVLNKSGKPITYVSLHLYFPRPKGQENERDLGFTLQYGVNPIWMRQKGLSIPPATSIPPGEQVEITLPDIRYDSLRRFLKELNYPSSIKTLRMSAEMLGFSDGTIWLGGEMYIQDANEPGKLIPLEKKKSTGSQK